MQQAWTQQLLTSLLTVIKPTSVLRWLAKREAHDHLRFLAQLDRPITHQDLDDLGDTRVAEHLRVCLRTIGALEDRDEQLARLENRCKQFLATDTTPDAPALRAYLNWAVLHRLRKQSRRSELTANMTRHALSRMRDIHHFHQWLAEHDLELATATQPVVEKYHIEHPTPWLAGYLSWARKCRRCADINLSLPKHGSPNVTMSNDDRWARVNELLTSPDGGTLARVAGLLILLYGQQLSKLVQLRKNAVRTGTAGSMEIALSTHPVPLPEPLLPLIEQLLNHPDGSIFAGASPWLFPGKRPGNHVTTGALSGRLSKIGLNTTQARSAALVALARELPGPVLADAAGIAPNTASGWAELAGERFQTYPAARIATAPPPQ